MESELRENIKKERPTGPTSNKKGQILVVCSADSAQIWHILPSHAAVTVQAPAYKASRGNAPSWDNMKLL